MASLSGGYNSSSSSYEKSGSTTGQQQGQVSKTLSAEQAAIQPSIFRTLQNYMLNPQAAINPARMAARNQVNNDYSGLANQVRQQFLTTGGGASGKAGEAQLQGSLGQAGALANVDSAAAQQAAALPLTAEQLAAQFLGINMGQTSSGTESGTSAEKGSGSQSGWNIGGGLKYTLPGTPSGGGGGNG